MKHETKLNCAGTWYSWECTCGRTARHLAPLHTADRNAKAHERKYNKLAGEARGVGAGKAGGE